MEKQLTEKKSKSKIVIIILLALLLITISIIGYFIATKNSIDDILNSFYTNKEYTLLLDEFIVNLRRDNSLSRYLKIEVALMYTDEKQEEFINSNVSKIRDVILENLRARSAEDMLNVDNIAEIKEKIKEDVNTALNEEYIKDVYFTNMVIQ